MNKLITIVGAAVAATSLAGCSGSVYAIAGPSAPEKVVELQASDALFKKFGDRTNVDCPQPLPAKVGVRITCRLVTSEDKNYGLTVSAEAVNGNDVNMGFEVVDAP